MTLDTGQGFEPFPPLDRNLDDTSPETPAQLDESCVQPTETCAQLAPATKTELAGVYGVSRTTIANWLTAVGDVCDRCGNGKRFKGDGDRVSVFAQAELADFRSMGADAYKSDRFQRHGVRDTAGGSLALTRTPIDERIPFDWEDEFDAVADVEFVESPPVASESLLMVQALADEAEQLNLVRAEVQNQTNRLLQRDRKARLQNMAAMAKRDATEDLTVYHRVYRDEMAKGGLA